MSQKGNLVGVIPIHSLQVESIFTVAHNEVKVKTTSLCFLCSYVKKNCTYANKLFSCQNDRIYLKTRKGKRQPVEAVMTFKISINREELVILVMPTQAKHSLSYTKYRTNLVTVL